MPRMSTQRPVPDEDFGVFPGSHRENGVEIEGDVLLRDSLVRTGKNGERKLEIEIEMDHPARRPTSKKVRLDEEEVRAYIKHLESQADLLN